MPRPTVVLGAGAAWAAGLVVASRFTPAARLNRLLNGNLRLFKAPADRRIIKQLAAGSRRYLLLGWPRPGIRDEQKVQLVTQAAAGAAGVEAARLQLLDAPLAPRKPHILEEHGDSRTDEYYWLRCGVLG